MAQQSNAYLSYIMDVSQSDLFLIVFPGFNLSFFKYLSVHCYRNCFGRFFVFSLRNILNTWHTFLLLFIVITGANNNNRHIVTNESIFKFPSNFINYYICLIFIYFNPTYIFLKTFSSKVSSRSAIFLFSTQDYVPYFDASLIKIL